MFSSDGMANGSVSQINPLLPKLSLVVVFITASESKLEQGGWKRAPGVRSGNRRGVITQDQDLR